MAVKRIVIIGAGPAGVTAGYELLRDRTRQGEKYEVILLEESGQIGGISRTVRVDGNRMDIGGHRFFSKDDRVNEWWHELMPDQGAPAMDDRLLGRKVPLAPGGPDPEAADQVMLLRDRVSRIYYRRRFFDYPVRINWNTIRNMGVTTTLQAGVSYLAAAVRKKPETSLENFYINRFGRKLYSMFFEGYTEKLWGRHPRAISADWGAQRVKGLSIVAILRNILQKLLPGAPAQVETSLIESFRYPKYGPGQLWETAAAEFEKMGGTLKLGCRVVGLRTCGSRVEAVEYEENGRRVILPADEVISSMPLKDLVAGMCDVPADVAAIAAGLPYRDFVTVGLCVREMAIHNETARQTLRDIVPDCWIYVQDTSVKLGRIQVFNNWSPYMVRDPLHTVWLGLEYFCTENDEYWNMTDRQWADFAAGELVKMGVLAGPDQVLFSHTERVKKAYPAYFDTWYEIDRLIAWLDRFENLYCVGRNGQHRYNNMDHSMATAFEAVRCIRTHNADKTALWGVNTESEYHEEKSARPASSC